jgi:hypothetical protein
LEGSLLSIGHNPIYDSSCFEHSGGRELDLVPLLFYSAFESNGA